jgi:hypothetical protein
LPVDGECLAVFFGEDLVQLGQSVEEDIVGDLNALEDLLVGLTNSGTGDKLVVNLGKD